MGQITGGPGSAETRPLQQLFDNNLARHFGVDGTEIVVSAGGREYVRELAIGIERPGVETLRLGCARGRVRYIIAVDPGHPGSDWDGQCGRVKGEIVDYDLLGDLGRPRRA